jgi:hypothetical protein
MTTTRASQVLIEVLLSILVLWALIPQIPAWCDRIAGPDPVAYQKLVSDNAVALARANYIAEMKMETARLEEELRAKIQTLKGIRAAQKRAEDEQRRAEDAQVHRAAQINYDAFSDRQNTLFAKCSSEKTSQRIRDELIIRIWLSDPYTTTCDKIPPY